MDHLPVKRHSLQALARFRAHLDCQSCGDPDSVTLARGHLQPTQNMQVVRNDCTPDILLKTLPSSPRAAGQSKRSLEPRNRGFNPRPEVAKPAVNPVAFDHLQNRKPPSFGKHHVLDSLVLGPSKIIHRRKPSIGCHLTGNSPIEPLLTTDQFRKKTRVSGISSNHLAVKNQPRTATCQMPLRYRRIAHRENTNSPT